MTFSFNLVDEPWIPCRFAAHERTTEVSLLEALCQAPAIREIGADSPLQTVALYRLLLAIVHRCFGPASADQWKQMWDAGRWDERVFSDYLTQWRDRLDLFDERKPFYQSGALDFSRGLYSLTRTFQLAATTTLFEHTSADPPPMISAAEAARLLVAFQSFDVGGIKSAEHDKDFADASPLTQCAVGVVRGENLFRTLMLNLHAYNAADEEPFPFDPTGEKPAWERDDDVQPIDRAPDGYLDLLTWQSRRIRLRPEIDPNGHPGVREAVVMKGFQFPDSFQKHDAETMVAFLRNPRATGKQPPWRPIGFRTERALWRDSQAILGSLPTGAARPKTLDWLHDLVYEGAIEAKRTVPVDFYGIAVDRANALFWRQERLPVPLAYLEDPSLLYTLRRALDLPQDVAKLFDLGWFDKSQKNPRPGQILANALHQNQRPNEKSNDARRRFEQWLDGESRYWAQLEGPFTRLMVALPEDRRQDADGDWVYGDTALPVWATAVKWAAQEAFRETTLGLGASALTLKAVAKADQVFGKQLAMTMRRFAERQEGDDDNDE